MTIEQWNLLGKDSKLRKLEYPTICTVLGVEQKGTRKKPAVLWITDGESRSKVSRNEDYEKVEE
jgi:hypothetical protein